MLEFKQYLFSDSPIFPLALCKMDELCNALGDINYNFGAMVLFISLAPTRRTSDTSSSWCLFISFLFPPVVDAPHTNVDTRSLITGLRGRASEIIGLRKDFLNGHSGTARGNQTGSPSGEGGGQLFLIETSMSI